VCSCNKTKTATSWVVTFANGSTETVRSEVAAKLKIGRNPGATYKAAPKPT
jgi:hypothetical protein